MLVRLGVLLALMSGFAFATQQKQVPDCCNPDTAKLSPRRVKAMVLKMEPIQPPGRAAHIDSTVASAHEGGVGEGTSITSLDLGRRKPARHARLQQMLRRETILCY